VASFENAIEVRLEVMSPRGGCFGMGKGKRKEKGKQEREAV
jgi:hypothetical protein